MRKHTFHWIILLILILAFSTFGNSCTSPEPNDVSPPSSIDINDASSLGIIGGWLSPEDLFFIWSPQSAPRVLGLNLANGAVSIISTPEIGWFPFVTVNKTGTMIGYTGYSEIILYDLIEQRIIQEVEGNAIAISPEGERLVVWQREKLLLGTLNSAELEMIFTIGEKSFDQEGIRSAKTEWRPSFNEVAFISKGYDPSNQNAKGVDEIILVNVETQEVKVIISLSRRINDFSWSPDGTILTYATSSESLDEGQLVLFDVQNLCEIGHVDTKWPPVAIWSPDGENILHHVSTSLDILNINNHFGDSYELLSCTEN